MSAATDTDVAAAPLLPVRGRYFAQRVVYPWELPSIMRKHIYTGAMGNIWGSLISGIFFLTFGTAIGLTPFQFSLMAGISSWLMVAQIFSGVLAERTGRRKVIWFWFAVVDRSLRFAGILAALWAWQAGWPHAGVLLIVAVCLANFFGTMATPPWMSWLADIIPEEHHGTFWGRRSAWIAFSVIAVVVPAGFLADRIDAGHKLVTLAAIFGAATAIGLADLLIHGTIPEPEVEVQPRDHFLKHILEPVRDPAFRPWLVFNVGWTYAMTFGGSLATLYFLDGLGLKKNLLGGALVLTTLTLLGSLFTGKWSGRLVDRIGTRPVLFGGHLFWSLLPLFWFVATPTTALLLLGVSSIIGGTSSTAASNAASKLVTRMPPPGRTATYAAVSASLGSVAAGLGVVSGGLVLRLLGDWTTTVAGQPLGAFHVMFAVSLCLRLTATLVLLPRLRGLAGENAAP